MRMFKSGRSLLRQFIKEAIATPTGSSQLAMFISRDGGTIALYDPAELSKEFRFFASRQMMSPSNSIRFALTSMVKAAISAELVDSNTMQITHSWSSERGLGPFLYDSVMALTGKSIVPDEKTSPAAMNVWRKYSSRGDVTYNSDPIMVTPATGFMSRSELQPLIQNHQRCFEDLFKHPAISGLISSAGVKEPHQLEEKFEDYCFRLLVDAVSG